VFEFLEVMGPLSDPARFGGTAADSFDVVVPSIPGFGFSSKPKAPIGPPTVARLWNQLMTEVLGYPKYAAQGGDWGSAVVRGLAANAPANLLAIHMNGGGGVIVPDSGLTDEERAWVAANARYRTQEFEYFNEQQHKPATVGFTLYDNPVGTAAWIVEKFKVWSDSGDNIEQTFTKANCSPTS
jgi:microsomal epoxide hydrolase